MNLFACTTVAVLLGFAGQANAETVYLKCGEGQPPAYVTVDVSKRLAKFSNEPVDDRPFNRAVISESKIVWSQDGRPVSKVVEFEFNRYSGIITEWFTSGEYHNVLRFNCVKIPSPTKKIL